LPHVYAIQAVCDAVTKPVNVVAGIVLRGGVTTVALEQCGVRRVSVGSALVRTAIGSMIDASKAIMKRGSFEAFDTAASFNDIEGLIQQGGVE